jgi:putative membrane protein
MMYGYGFSWIGDMIMMIFWVLILVAIVLGALYFARNVGQPTTVSRVESPLDILNRRYASGEINKEQFEEMKQTLGV